MFEPEDYFGLSNSPAARFETPLGYFITWTTYGTWLHGDERGWFRKGEGLHFGGDTRIYNRARDHMVESTFYLSPADRRIVEDVVRRHCEIRHWPLHAVNPRSNHVHVVLTADAYKPEDVRDQLKAWATRHLRRIHRRRKRFWTEGGDSRWLYTYDDLTAAVEYVNEGQDRKDRDQR